MKDQRIIYSYYLSCVNEYLHTCGQIIISYVGDVGFVCGGKRSRECGLLKWREENEEARDYKLL